MDCSTPGFPVLHQLRELAQTHAHRVSDAIQPSHPLLSPSQGWEKPPHHPGPHMEVIIHNKQPSYPQGFGFWFSSLLVHDPIHCSLILLFEGTSLVVQWLRIHLLMQGMWIQYLVRELTSHSGRAAKPTCH